MTPLPTLDLADRKAEKEFRAWEHDNIADLTIEQRLAGEMVLRSFDECRMNKGNPAQLKSATDVLEQRIARLRELLG